ncbi:MAG: hypothetical protein LW750_02980 [Bacteroidetes bacterium]|nr:hypothetical protein [Bacteroidota bacterium]
MKKVILFLGVTFSAHLFAQIDMGLPTASGKGGAATALVGNYEAIGINPSNLGLGDNYKFSFTLANAGLTVQSKALKLGELRNALTNPNDTFTAAEKQMYANLFTTEDGLNLNANVNWFAASLYFPKLGGIAVNMRDRAFGNVSLSQNAADFIFNGINSLAYQDSSVYSQYMSQIFNGTSLAYLHYREMNIAYGRKLFGFGTEDDKGRQALEVFGGVGFKYLWGLGNVNAKITNALVSGTASFSTNYNINYGNIQNFNPHSVGSIFNAVGTGVATDFGATVVLLMPQLDTNDVGLNSWNMSSPSFLFGDNAVINYTPGTDYKNKLPSRLRFGYGMTIGEKIMIGADVVLPLNKSAYNLETMFVALGGEVKLGSVIRFNMGVSGSTDLGWNLPCGLIIGPLGFLELGLAAGDVLTFVDKSKNPNMSLALGLIRFNFGNDEE